MNFQPSAKPGFRPARRTEAIGVSEILRIGASAAARREAGRPMITLGAGEPDFDTPPNVKAAAERAIRRGATKYTILDGTLELKAAIIEKFCRDNGLTYNVDEISVGAGAKQVMHNAFMATLDPDDEVILAAPYWTSYADMVILCGGNPVLVACREEEGYRLDEGDLERAITPRTRWLVLNSPSNPSGAAYSAAQLRPLIEVLERHPHVWLLSDDIYEHFIYDSRPFATAAQLDAGLKQRTLTVNGVSKAYAMTGWRVGFGGGPAPLIAAMAVIQSQSTSNPCSISQAAAVEALTGPQAVLSERRSSYEKRRDLVVSALNAVEGLSCRLPEGAFYAFVGCGGLIGRYAPNGTLIDSDGTFCSYLLHQHDIAVVPGTCFGLSPYFRVSYAASEQMLREGCERIARACEALS